MIHNESKSRQLRREASYVQSERVAAELKAAPSLVATVFVIAGAERVYPVIAGTASEATSNVARNILDAAWKSVVEDVKASTAWEEEVMSLPESSIDDSHDPRYYAMRALGVIFDVAKILGDPASASEVAVSNASGLFSLANDLDYHKDGYSEGGLLLQELKVEMDLVLSAKAISSSQLKAQIDEIRDRARSDSAMFTEGVREHLRFRPDRRNGMH